MPSIQDVADQINAKLDQINNNTAATVAVGNGIRDDIQRCCAETSSGLFAIWELQKVTNSILAHHTRQNDATICLLENANELLCGMTRKLTRQLDLSEQLLMSLKRIEGISERVNATEAGDFDRLAEVQDRILECCPPEEAEPEPCPEPCPRPEYKEPYRPEGQDWAPSPQRDKRPQ